MQAPETGASTLPIPKHSEWMMVWKSQASPHLAVHRLHWQAHQLLPQGTQAATAVQRTKCIQQLKRPGMHSGAGQEAQLYWEKRRKEGEMMLW